MGRTRRHPAQGTDPLASPWCVGVQATRRKPTNAKGNEQERKRTLASGLSTTEFLGWSTVWQRLWKGTPSRQDAKTQRRQEVSLVRNIPFPASPSGIRLRKIGNNEPDFSANSLVGLRSKTSLYTYGRSRPQRAAMPEVSRRLPNRHSGRRAPGGAGWRIQPSSSLNGLVYIQRL